MITFTDETEEERKEKGHCAACFSCKLPCGRVKVKPCTQSDNKSKLQREAKSTD